MSELLSPSAYALTRPSKDSTCPVNALRAFSATDVSLIGALMASPMAL